MSDTLNAIGLLIGGMLIAWFGLEAVGGWQALQERLPAAHLNAVGGDETSVPFHTVFTGILLLNLFYWCTNQQIIQRTFGASSLAEGQKGVLLTGLLKLLGPMYLVLPGMIAFALFADRTGAEAVPADHAYGRLVAEVLPPSLSGFFAAVLMGAILSSFNSALNATCTLFSLGLFKPTLRPEADERTVIRAGKWFGIGITLFAMITAPLLAQTESIFSYLQKMNGIYFIPIFAVVVMGFFHKRLPPIAAKVGLIGGVCAIAAGYFLPPFTGWVTAIHDYHFLGAVFAGLLVVMAAIAAARPRSEPWIEEDVGAVDLTPWRGAWAASALLIVLVIGIYLVFSL